MCVRETSCGEEQQKRVVAHNGRREVRVRANVRMDQTPRVGVSIFSLLFLILVPVIHENEMSDMFSVEGKGLGLLQCSSQKAASTTLVRSWSACVCQPGFLRTRGEPLQCRPHWHTIARMNHTFTQQYNCRRMHERVERQLKSSQSAITS